MPQSPRPHQGPAQLPPPRTTAIEEVLRDNAGKVISAQQAWRTDDIDAVATQAIANGDAVLMVGAQTSATSNFDLDYRRPPTPRHGKTVVVIQPRTLAVDSTGAVLATQSQQTVGLATLAGDSALPLRSDQLRIHLHREGADRHTITLGAGITFAQVNRALRELLGADEHADWCVPIDLTTVDIAQAGAVYATGAQGPSRFRISDVAKAVTLSDGRQLLRLSTQPDIAAHEGLWGMTGAVVQLELRVYRRPKHRFGFFIPLTRSSSGNWIDQVAAVLALLRQATDLRLDDGQMVSGWSNGLLDGAEVVARETLELVATTKLPTGTNRAVALKILALMHERERSGKLRSRSDFGIYLTGNSRFSELDAFLDDPTSPLAKLLEYAEHSEAFLHTEGMTTVIDDERGLEEMRLLREAFADISRQHAKHRQPGQGKPFSESTDINCFLDPQAALGMSVDELRENFRWILQPYYAYEMRIRDLAEVAKTYGATVTMTRYGHLNPRSTNLHTRVTVHAPQESIHAQVFQQVVQRARDNLLAVLKDLSVRRPAVRVQGGEKGKMTAEAWELMDQTQRDSVVELLARSNPQWQPHLKGHWADRVRQVRAAG
ncbi:MAG: FAD-binding oxidoreductase [Myxococcales bacterium]|nr:FAD-binding oxidoreductase [Myxococcales bacterium]